MRLIHGPCFCELSDDQPDWRTELPVSPSAVGDLRRLAGDGDAKLRAGGLTATIPSPQSDLCARATIAEQAQLPRRTQA